MGGEAAGAACTSGEHQLQAGVADTAILNSGRAWGGRLLLRDSETLTFAAGPPDGESPLSPAGWQASQAHQFAAAVEDRFPPDDSKAVSGLIFVCDEISTRGEYLMPCRRQRDEADRLPRLLCVSCSPDLR